MANAKQTVRAAIDAGRDRGRDPEPGAWVLVQAATAIGRARRLGTPDARLLYHDGAIRMATGDSIEGHELVRRALRMNPAFDATAASEAATSIAAKLATR